MLGAYTGAAIRAAEEPLLAKGRGADLMRRAAHGLAVHLVRLLRSRRGGVYGARIVVLAGTGNNGGDALFAAAELIRRGARATAVRTAGRIHTDAAAAFARAGGRFLTLEDSGPEDSGPEDGEAGDGGPGIAAALREARGADIILDGLLGTGAGGALRGPAAALVRALADGPLHAAVVACDLPSGVDADTGTAAGAVLPADLTVTFGGAKLGLLAAAGESLAGRLEVVGIGLDLPAADLLRLQAADIAALLPVPERSSHKYTRGVLGIVAGSARYPGAAQLCASAAADTGTGMVRYLGPGAVATLIHAGTPEAVCSGGTVADSRVQAWLVGPGIDGDDGQLRRAADALASGLPVAADAGALSVLPERVGPHVVLTPHAGELAALFAARGVVLDRAGVERDPVAAARRAARLTGATVLLKGATTVVAGPTGPVFSQSEGTPWLSTAGSGDTLAGILGALMASLAHEDGRFAAAGIGGDTRWAVIAAMAASIHGRAGSAAGGGGPLRATAVAAAVPGVIADLLRGRAGGGQRAKPVRY
ncbi:MAG: bifunctional ADP-dependent NAD(P)H-hydrate dehydratase/NAD(P)H-hydrate epimerase [Actinomycetales bacterium]